MSVDAQQSHVVLPMLSASSSYVVTVTSVLGKIPSDPAVAIMTTGEGLDIQSIHLTES